MTEEQRMGLLRVFASVNSEYQQLRKKAKEAELRMEQVDSDLTDEQIEALWELVGAYEDMDHFLLKLACRHLIFPVEK